MVNGINQFDVTNALNARVLGEQSTRNRLADESRRETEEIAREGKIITQVANVLRESPNTEEGFGQAVASVERITGRPLGDQFRFEDRDAILAQLGEAEDALGLTKGQRGKVNALVASGVPQTTALGIVGGGRQATEAGVFNIATGGEVKPAQPLTKGTKTDIQKRLAKGVEQVEKIKKIRGSFDRSFLTRLGGARAFAAREADRLSDIPVIGTIANAVAGDEKFLKGFTNFTQQIEQIFQAYRQEITGAAASDKEIERLKQAVLNADQSPSQFEASLDLFEEALERGNRIKRRLLREGIDVGSEGFGPRFDQEFFAGQTQEAAAPATEAQAGAVPAPGAAQAAPVQTDAISLARDAIQRGADPQAVRQRLLDNGVDPAQAGL